MSKFKFPKIFKKIKSKNKKAILTAIVASLSFSAILSELASLVFSVSLNRKTQKYLFSA